MGASSACHRGWSAIRARRECTTTVSATVTLRPLPCDKLAGVGRLGAKVERESPVFILVTRDRGNEIVRSTVQGTTSKERLSRMETSLRGSLLGIKTASCQASESRPRWDREEKGRKGGIAGKGLSDFTHRGTGCIHLPSINSGCRDLSRQPVENKCGASCNFLRSIRFINAYEISWRNGGVEEKSMYLEFRDIALLFIYWGRRKELF